MSQEEKGKLFTTGEVAEMCGVSVRTVQYYDDRGLVSPSERSEGGRRLYSEEAIGVLRTVCLLKSMGLSLRTIREVLARLDDTAALECILDEQEKAIAADLDARRAMIRSIAAVRASLSEQGRMPEVSETCMDNIMAKQTSEKTRLYRMKRRMIVEGLAIDAVLISAVVLGVTRSEWLVFALVLPLSLIVAWQLAEAYHRDARYVCPHCREAFSPSLREFMFSRHTPVARKLSCPCCGTRDWCAEASVDSVESAAS